MPSGREQIIHENINVGISGLTAGSIQSAGSRIDALQENGFMIRRVRGAMTWFDKTTTLGPMIVGAFTGSLTSTEIKEAVDADPQGAKDTPATERANRKLWPIWLVPAGIALNSEEQSKYEDIYWPYREKEEGESMGVYVQNIDGTTITAATVTVAMVFFGEWTRD